MSEYRSSYSGAQVDEAVAKALEPKVFWVELSGDYPNYTCTTNLSEIATAYNAGNQLYCRCSMGQYTAALPLFVPMPSINTWLFSGSGQLQGGGYEFPAQTFTIAISANGVVAEDTRLATGNSRLASPFALKITNGDTEVLYDGSEAKSVTLSAEPQGPQGPAGPTGPTGPAGKDGFTPTGGALTPTSVLYDTTNGATLSGPLALLGTPNNLSLPFSATLPILPGNNVTIDAGADGKSLVINSKGGGAACKWTDEAVTLLQTVFANLAYTDATTGQQAADALITILDAGPQLTRITATAKPGNHYVGDTLTTEDFVVTGYYDNGDSEQITSSYTIAPTALTRAGNTTVTITYKSLVTTVTIAVQTNLAQSWTIDSYTPTKTPLYVDDDIRVNGYFTYTITFANGRAQTFTSWDNITTINPTVFTDTSTMVAATLIYAGLTDTQNYTITGIRAKPVPTTLEATYTGSTTVGTEVTAANWSYTVKDQYGNTITPGGTLVQSPNSVTLIEGDNVIGLTLMYATGQISTQKTIVGVAVAPTLTGLTATYTGGAVAAGTTLDQLNEVVKATYSDGTTSAPLTKGTDYTLSGALTPGQTNTVMVTGQGGYAGFTTTFSVTVEAAPGATSSGGTAQGTGTKSFANIVQNNAVTNPTSITFTSQNETQPEGGSNLCYKAILTKAGDNWTVQIYRFTAKNTPYPGETAHPYATVTISDGIVTAVTLPRFQFSDTLAANSSTVNGYTYTMEVSS